MWYCKTCGYVFKWVHTLTYHIQEMHGVESPLDNKVPPVYGSVGRKGSKIRRNHAS